MAAGDLAAAAGLDVFPATADVRQGYENDNIRGDELADHMLNGGHSASKITGLTAAAVKSGPTGASTVQADLDFVSTRAGEANTAAANAAAAAAAANANAASRRPYDDGNFGNTPIFTPHGRNNPVSSSYVAAYINGDGRLGASPSSRRYKENITDLSVPVADVLAIEPREFDRIDGAHEVGLIAEEVHEHVPQIVVWTGEHIDGVHYHLLPVLQQAVIRAHEQRITDLEHQVADLLARLDTPEV